MSTSSIVSAGENATATQYNNVRTDAITRYIRYVWFIKGSVSVENDTSIQYLVPATMTVTKTKSKISSGTSATFKIKNATTGNFIKTAGTAATTTAADDSTVNNAALTENDILQLDITAVSGSPVDLIVELFATETI